MDMNRKGLEYLKEDKFGECLAELKTSERMLVKILRSQNNNSEALKLLAVTLNNLACYNKK